MQCLLIDVPLLIYLDLFCQLHLLYIFKICISNYMREGKSWHETWELIFEASDTNVWRFFFISIYNFTCSVLYRLYQPRVEELQICLLMQLGTCGKFWIAFWPQATRLVFWISFILCDLRVSVVNICSFDLVQLTLRRVMDAAKQSTKSGSLNEISMVLLNNSLSIPFAILLIIVFNEWQYVYNT